MRIEKKVISKLEKCYALAPFFYKGKECFLAASAKEAECRIYDMEGNMLEVVWDSPGGVMTMVQNPDSGGQFLATRRFYSPNDSSEASIITASPRKPGGWEIQTLTKLPFVHRFDILRNQGKKYLIACTLKSGHKYKDDWSEPGKVYGAELPFDLSKYHNGHPLKLQVIKDSMLKNHGYCKNCRNGEEKGIIACHQGIYEVSPPSEDKDMWRIERLLETPASEAFFADIDQCGEEELFLFSPFHGDKLEVYKIKNGRFRKIYEHPQKLEFLHAAGKGYIGSTPAVFIGHRKGDMDLLALISDGNGELRTCTLDHGCGAANVLYRHTQGRDILIAANREIDELAMYYLNA